MTGWRVLTLKQPWAFAITYLGKRVENRVWAPNPAKLPLRVMIHAGKGWDPVRGHGRSAVLPDRSTVLKTETAAGYEVCQRAPSTSAWMSGTISQPFSAVVAVATITSAHHGWDRERCQRRVDYAGGPDVEMCSDWAEDGGVDEHGQMLSIQHWVLEDVEPLLQAVPAKGKLGLWVPDADLVEAVERQMF